jgi:hypothetical protein
MFDKINSANSIALTSVGEAKTYLSKLQDERVYSMTELPPMAEDMKLVLTSVIGNQDIIDGYQQSMMDGLEIGPTTQFRAKAAYASNAASNFIFDTDSVSIDIDNRGTATKPIGLKTSSLTW